MTPLPVYSIFRTAGYNEGWPLSRKKTRPALIRNDGGRRFRSIALRGGHGQATDGSMNQAHPPSPSRLLEMLVDRFGAFEAIANSSIKLARYAPEEQLAMDLLVAEAVLEFGSELRATARGVNRRMRDADEKRHPRNLSDGLCAV